MKETRNGTTKSSIRDQTREQVGEKKQPGTTAFIAFAETTLFHCNSPVLFGLLTLPQLNITVCNETVTTDVGYFMFLTLVSTGNLTSSF